MSKLSPNAPSITAAGADLGRREAAYDANEVNGSERLDCEQSLSRDYALAALRVAAARVRLLVIDVDMIGLGLRGGWVSPEGALLWCRDLGVLELVGAADFEKAVARHLETAVP